MNSESLMIKQQLGAFRIANRWLDDHYLHVENRVLEVGVIGMNWQSAVWDIVQVAGTPFVRVENQWQSGSCLQIEDGELGCGHPVAESTGSHWYAERIKGSRFYRFRHGSSGDAYLHFEDRILQVGPIDTAWWSAEWELHPA